jgi:DNA-binding NtrC family response regulator
VGRGNPPHPPRAIAAIVVIGVTAMARATIEQAPAHEPSIEVLLVDDDAGQREMCRRRLERAGYDVRLADSADSAADQVRARRPAVVVLDIAMPGRDGLSALQELLDIEPAMPVVINTAYPAFVDNFLAWAADAYVQKTSDMAPLLSAIHTLTAAPSAARVA